MSLSIDVDRVRRVLLSDGWHDVATEKSRASSFYFDAYEFIYYGSDERRKSGDFIGTAQIPRCSTGFAFKDAHDDVWMYGPLDDIRVVVSDA